MNTKYFSNVTTQEELKAQYKKLAFKHHPDRGGNVETMQAINAEYEELAKTLKNSNGHTETQEQSNEFIEIINKLMNELTGLTGAEKLTIDIVGSWIWIYNVGKDDKEITSFLKSLQFFWNREKQVWRWYSRLNGKAKFRKNQDTSDIYNKYGNTTLKSGKGKKGHNNPILT